MGTLLGQLVYILFMFGGCLVVAHGAIWDTKETCVQFSHCLIGKISNSPFFNFEDLNDIIGIANVMINAMDNTGFGPSGVFTRKMLVIAFVTSVSDIVILEDTERNFLRKGACQLALTECSMSTIGYIDTDFMNIAWRILSTVEIVERPAYDTSSSFGEQFSPSGSEPNSGGSAIVFDPSSIQPSPVQRTLIPDYVSNGKTKFNTPEGSSFGTLRSTSFGNPEGSSSFSAPGGSTFDSPRDSVFDAPGGSSFGTIRGLSLDSPETSFSDALRGGSYDSAGSSFDSPSSSQISQPNSRPEYTEQQAGNFGLSSNSNSTSTRQSESHSETVASSFGHVSFSDGGPLQPFPAFGGLIISQAEDSKVISAPPSDSQESNENLPLQDTSEPKTEEISTEPASIMIPASTQNADAMTSPPSLPFSTQIVDTPIETTDPSSPSLESIISNILINSTSFTNAFSTATNQRDAINTAKLITQESFSGYDADIINEALNAVSAAVATVTFSSPRNYALAISSALAVVLRLHNLPLVGEGATFASSMLTNLNNTEHSFDKQANYTEVAQDSFSDDYVPSWGEQPQPPLDFQSPVLVPEDVAGEIFSNTLAQYLAESHNMKYIFCKINGTLNATTYFILIKSALSEYGTQVSSIAASTISRALVDRSLEALCSSFARVISDATAVILYENELLETANPDEISKQFDISASNLTTITTRYNGQQATSGDIYSSAIISSAITDKIVPTPQSSFTENYSKLDRATFDQTSAEYFPPTVVDAYSPSVLEDVSTAQQHDEYIGTTTQGSNSPEKETRSEYDSLHYQTTPETTPTPARIIDQEFTSTPASAEVLTNAPEASPTEVSSPDYTTINEGEIASFLMDEIESVLEALGNTSDVQEKPTITPCEISPDDVTVPSNNSPDSAQNSTDTSTSHPEETMSTKSPHQKKRKLKRKNNRQNTTPQPDSDISSYADEGSEDVSAETRSRSSNRQQKPPSSAAEDKNATASGSSEDSANVRSVELQPSFQEPVSSDSSSPSKMLPSSSYETVEEDPSLIMARALSRIATSSIEYIRSSQNLDIEELCRRLNELAAIVDIPPVDNCKEISLIDYLLNVLKSVTTF